VIITGNDFGNTTNVLLAGKVFNDVNSNGIQDAGEEGLAGFMIVVVANNTIIATRLTGSLGSWQIKGLPAGTGQVNVLTQAGYVPTTPTGGVYAGTSTSGQQFGNLNFGLHGSGAVAPRTAASPVPVGSPAQWVLTLDELGSA